MEPPEFEYHDFLANCHAAPEPVMVVALVAPAFDLQMNSVAYETDLVTW